MRVFIFKSFQNNTVNLIVLRFLKNSYNISNKSTVNFNWVVGGYRDERGSKRIYSNFTGG